MSDIALSTKYSFSNSIKFFFLLIFAGILAINSFVKINSVILVYGIIVNLFLIYYNRFNRPVYVFYIFISTYLIYLTIYFLFHIKFHAYKNFDTDENYNITLVIAVLFLVLIFLFSDRRKKPFSVHLDMAGNSNIFCFILSFTIMTLILFYSITGDMILVSSAYGKGEVSRSTLTEYYYIFYLLSYYYARKSKRNRVLMIVMGLLFSVKTVLFGSRIEAIQMFAIIYILYFQEKVSLKALTFILLIGLLLSELWGIIRSNIFEAAKLISGYSSVPEYILTNQGDVFYAANVYVNAALHDPQFDLLLRLRSFIGFCIGLIMPSSLTFKEASLAVYTSGIYAIGGGGLISAYAYFWLDIFGVFFMSYFIAYLINRTTKQNGKYMSFYLILVFATFPRWFAYSPINLFKLCVWGVIIFWIFENVIKMSLYKLKPF